jgi:hypothetical protein
MVTRYGVAETLGPRTYAPPPQPFLDRGHGGPRRSVRGLNKASTRLTERPAPFLPQKPIFNFCIDLMQPLFSALSLVLIRHDLSL